MSDQEVIDAYEVPKAEIINQDWRLGRAILIVAAVALVVLGAWAIVN